MVMGSLLFQRCSVPGPSGRKVHGLGKIDMSAIGQGEYSGQWAHGSIVGQGTRVWPTGDIYIGDWDESSRMHGRGGFVWKDGSQYVGEFQRGRRSGNGKQFGTLGIITSDNGATAWKRNPSEPKRLDASQTIGLWERGNLVKELILGKDARGQNKFIGIST